ncbi:hypothetical protein LA080_005530 [Diaporthe eres]|nr:hypothetical protein LA080_005530 [Diaporthe eres]
MAFRVKNVALVGTPAPSSLRPSNVIRTDYSPESLEQSFKGQDAVVMLLPPESSVQHQTVIDAARRAGVKRLFPSEFGVRTNHPAFHNNVVLCKKKWSHIKHLEKTQGVMSWTAIFCNPWIDHCVIDGLIGIYLEPKVARIYNGGNVPFSTGTRDLVSKVLTEILSTPEHMEDTKNKFIHLASYTTTQNEVREVVEKLTGEKFEVQRLKSEEVLPQAVEDVK